jgi:4-hydroxybenzoate polyprenyltransferase
MRYNIKAGILAIILGLAIVYISPNKLTGIINPLCSGFIYGLAILGGYYFLDGTEVKT